MPSLMLESVYAEQDKKPVPTIVDLGYVSDPGAEQRFRAIRERGVSIRNFSREAYDRLFVKLPKMKAAAEILAALPIVEGETYWRATHHWQGLGAGETPAST